MKQMIQPPGSTPDHRTSDAASAQPQMIKSSGIDVVKLKQYLHVIIRRIWIVAICFVVALLFSVMKISKQESVFQSSASILLSRGMQLPGQFAGQETAIFGDFMETQLRIINSRSVINRAREIMNVPEAEVARLFRSSSVWPIGRSAVVSISVTSLDPVFSANYANAIANSYIAFKQEEHASQAQNTSINLMQQANKIREELRKAEDVIVLFKKENSLVLTLRDGNIAAGVMADLARRTAAHRLERMILEFQRPLLSEATDDVLLTALSSRYVPVYRGAVPGQQEVEMMNPSRDTMNDPSNLLGPMGTVDIGNTVGSDWTNLRKKKNILENELIMNREMLRDTHPVVRKLLQEIRVVDASIDREVQYAMENYFSQLEALNLKEASLTKVKSLWLDEAMDTEVLMDRYNILKNDIDRLRTLLDAVFARIREIDISSGIIPDNVSVVEEAVPKNSPLTPRKIQSIFLAGLIGIGLGIGIIFGLEFLDDSIKFPEEISSAIGLKFLGIIPAANWSSTDIRTHLLNHLDPKGGLAEAYRNVRATLLLEGQNRGIKTMLVTSSVPREGKTTTSLNLAISLAQAGLRVLLVDADMRRGEIHKFFGLEGGRGLSDVLKGQAKTESVIQRTGVANLDMIATGPFPANPAEIILRSEFKSFVEYIQRTYDKIVFDGPPVMAVSEAAVLASLVDSTIMVVWAGKTSRKLCQITIQNLLQRGARIDGCILNNLEFGRVGYYYYSTYYSYYNYDYRYDEKTTGT